MVAVEFEDKKTRVEGVERIALYHDRSLTRGIGAWMMRHGIVKSRVSADLVMIILTVLCVIVSLYLLLFTPRTPKQYFPNRTTNTSASGESQSIPITQ